jgi:hypothetical protein
VSVVDIDKMARDVTDLKNDVEVALLGAVKREVMLSTALEKTQVAIDKLTELAKRDDLMDRLVHLHDILDGLETSMDDLRGLLPEARAAEKSLRQLLVTAQEERRFRQPWWRRLLGRGG